MTGFRSVRAGLFAVAAIIAAASIGCAKNPFSPSQNTGQPFSIVEVTIGTGAQIVPLSTVVVDYAGYLYDASKPNNEGLLFDTSLTTQPISFVVGAGQVIAGLEQGVLGMKVGGFRRVIIPPELGYGPIGQYPVPKNATLVFEISLLGASVPQ
jgi:FKBP-type peptidyl-prolyl cis-trans isomerase FkpA